MSEKKSQEKKKATDKKLRPRGYGLRGLDTNMTRRAVRVYKRVHYFEIRRQKRISGNLFAWPVARDIAHSHATTEAKRCASAHGVVVEARLHRWLQN